jgi:hypothetical protein
MYWPETLRAEVQAEVYLYIDKYYKKLPTVDGIITGIGSEFLDNDVDALRHSYASGVFTQEYGEDLANFFGQVNEWAPGIGSSTSYSSESKNMDLWNNAVGRRYGKKTRSRLKLFKFLIKALEKGELIINPDKDPRKFKGRVFNLNSLQDKVIVIKESKKGKNLKYFDFEKLITLSRSEFISEIKMGNYPFYEIRIVKGDETPVSKKDKNIPNNLG